MGILEIQERFRAAGFQWWEHIFNDEHKYVGDCMIKLTQDKSPHAFSSYPRPEDTVGWGRFSRIQCWEMAYQWLLQREKTCSSCKSLDICEGQCMDCGSFIDGINHVKFVYPSPSKNFPNQFESVGGNYK